MSIFDRHPSSDALNDFASPTSGQADDARRRVSSHLERCADCRARVQWVRSAANALANERGAALPAGLRERILAARAGGARAILPVNEHLTRAVPSRWRWAMSAAAVIIVAIGIGWGNSREAVASATAGELRFAPSLPRVGEHVRVSYLPLATIGTEENLVLRARLRTVANESYNGGISSVSLATLAKDRSGRFEGEFTLPPGVVFGAFVVEDETARRVDDNDGRHWELLTRESAATPSFNALDQRAHDLMGRNWEEGHATVRQMVKLYPGEIRAWSWLNSFQGWLGLRETDSVQSLHRERLATFDAMHRAASSVDPAMLGMMYWYARTIDTATAVYWERRMMREAPTTSFAIQQRWGAILTGFYENKDTATALARFDSLWREATPDRRLQVAGTAFDVARGTADSVTMRRWSERILAGSTEPLSAERGMAQAFAEMPRHRTEGIERIRRSLARLDSTPDALRPLGQTREDRQRTIERFRRRLLASLGRALVADGKTKEGLEVLATSAEEGWDLSVLRSARAASLAAGDTAGAMRFAARIASDPRTEAAASAADEGLATKAIGGATWQAALEEAERVFVDRMLVSSTMTTLRGRARVRDPNGGEFDLAKLAQGQVTVVAIWSRSCGPAVDDLPNIGRVGKRLEAEGVRVIGVIEERAMTPELAAFLKEKGVTMTTYLDAFGEVSKAFNSWGTPSYYVLDAQGRVRFDATSDAEELLARAEAVRLEVTVR